MKKIAITLALSVLASVSVFAAVTLDDCLEKAEENYPLIKKYGLIERTARLALSDINKSWLPRIGVYGQTTVQNVVPEFPQSLDEMLTQLGQDVRGLGRVQYKAGVDVTQTIWDGGAARAERKIEQVSSAERQAAVAVQIYAIREKVMDLYFGILLMDEQIARTESTVALLDANLALMRSLLAGGVAMQSDVDMVEAQMLDMTQQLVSARSAAKAYRDVLSIYVGESLDGQELARPDAAMPSGFESERPELALFDAQTRLNSARAAAVESSVMPRAGFFAQGYYGYPGINYFESMMKRDLSFNLLAGIKISWNIDSFYTKRNSERRLALESDNIENDRDVFLYNTRLRAAAQIEEIEGVRAVMAEDARIVALRSNVRLAAESQLKNGVIDATALLAKITDENRARLMAAYHEIQLIQNIYKLKNTLNR